MNRDITNRINIFMDEWIPPRIRDSKTLVRILFRMVIGKKYVHYMDFKEKFPLLSEEDVNRYYEFLNKTFIGRETHCNRACVERIVKESDGKKVLDCAGGAAILQKLFIKMTIRWIVR